MITSSRQEQRKGGHRYGPDKDLLEEQYREFGTTYTITSGVDSGKVFMLSNTAMGGIDDDITNNDNWIDVTVQQKPIQVTYAQLETLIANSLLLPLRYYEITDFQTIQDLGTDAGIVSGPIESLVVQATAVNVVDKQARSTARPTDTIEYDATRTDFTRDALGTFDYGNQYGDFNVFSDINNTFEVSGITLSTRYSMYIEDSVGGYYSYSELDLGTQFTVTELAGVYTFTLLDTNIDLGSGNCYIDFTNTSVVGATKGRITYRKDSVNNLTCNFDFMGRRIKRYALDPSVFGTNFDANTVYNIRQFVKNGSSYSCPYLPKLKGGYNSAEWVVVADYAFITAKNFCEQGFYQIDATSYQVLPCVSRGNVMNTKLYETDRGGLGIYIGGNANNTDITGKAITIRSANSLTILNGERFYGNNISTLTLESVGQSMISNSYSGGLTTISQMYNSTLYIVGNSKIQSLYGSNVGTCLNSTVGAVDSSAIKSIQQNAVLDNINSCGLDTISGGRYGYMQNTFSSGNLDQNTVYFAQNSVLGFNGHDNILYTSTGGGTDQLVVSTATWSVNILSGKYVLFNGNEIDMIVSNTATTLTLARGQTYGSGIKFAIFNKLSGANGPARNEVKRMWYGSLCGTFMEASNSSYAEISNATVKGQNFGNFGTISSSNILISGNSNEIQNANLFDIHGSRFSNFQKNKFVTIYSTTIKNVGEISSNMIVSMQNCSMYFGSGSGLYSLNIGDMTGVYINGGTTTTPYTKLMRSSAISQIFNGTISQDFYGVSGGAINLFALTHNYNIRSCVIGGGVLKNLSTVPNIGLSDISKSVFSTSPGGTVYKNFVTQYDYNTETMITTVI